MRPTRDCISAVLKCIRASEAAEMIASNGWEIEQRHAPKIMSRVFGEEGYCDEMHLRPDELSTLRKITSETWLSVIRRVAPDKVKQFERNGIEQYHQLSHLIDHARIWSTQERTYPTEAVDEIRSFSVFDFFDREFPGYRISTAMPPYGDWGRTRINWRLVRPGKGLDLGPIHADHWFEAVIDGWRPDPETVRVKMWVPIHLELGLTGFAYLPGSHRMSLPFGRKSLADGSVKPEFDEANLPCPLKTMLTPCGTALLFNYSLVHRGENSDRATRTRVSMELTLELPRQPLEKRYGALGVLS
jgi:hypothetical protein